MGNGGGGWGGAWRFSESSPASSLEAKRNARRAGSQKFRGDLALGVGFLAEHNAIKVRGSLAVFSEGVVGLPLAQLKESSQGQQERGGGSPPYLNVDT